MSRSPMQGILLKARQNKTETVTLLPKTTAKYEWKEEEKINETVNGERKKLDVEDEKRKQKQKTVLVSTG
jgi:hypothetical protein